MMRIQAFMPVLDECDILPWALRHMREQGIEIQVLDGWSSDGSYELARDFGQGVTVEHFPAEAPSAEWACRPTLRRIEQLAAQSGGDWCGLSDADEFRWCLYCETLHDGIVRLDRAGYNAIDHQVFSFACTDSAWTPDIDPRAHFRWFDPADMIARLPQIKWWKNTGRAVDLHTTGGHEARFPGRLVSTERWTMKHYPYRTPTQARAKIETRLKRRCHDEHRDGWGVHYDAFPQGFDFCWRKEALKEWGR